MLLGPQELVEAVMAVIGLRVVLRLSLVLAGAEAMSKLRLMGLGPLWKTVGASSNVFLL
jgi:hypothetical protein